MTAKHQLDYRADIDGLRAIAVLSVLIYHAGFYWQGQKLLSGGFLGVDVFFVISGYLICSILMRELHAGGLDFAAFYERRARRILPALFLVMICSLTVAPFILPPDPLKEFASSAAATSAFVSNIFFWLQDSYTAEPSLRKPLLHTWSLAVEEQFYLLFPVFLWFAWKKGSGRLMWVFTLVAVASLLYAEWGSYYLPSANFYLLPSRIWELIAGAILALAHSRGWFKQVCGLFGWLGFALVATSLVMFDDTARHPSLWTLLPVVGTVIMIIEVPASPRLNKLLSSKLMVGVGLVSYSLYLWHQPVFAFARVYTGSELTVMLKLGLIALCLTLAVISWRFVETPFRRPDKASMRLLLCGLGSFSIALLAFVVATSMGIIPGVADSVMKASPYPICREQGYVSQDGRTCDERSPLDACTFVAGSSKQNWYVVGDSTANRLSYPLWEHLRGRDASLTVLTKGDCPYVPGLSITADGKVRCAKSDNLLRRKILLEASPSIVVIHSLLHIYIHGSRNRPHLESKILRLHMNIGATSEIIEVEDISRHVRLAIEELLEHGHRVVLVYPIHMTDFDVGHRLAQLEQMPPHKRKNLLTSDRFSKSYQEFRTFADVAYQIYDSLDDHQNLIRVLPEDLFCDASGSGRCKIVDQDASLYGNFTHLSYFGACKLVSAIFEALPQTAGRGGKYPCRAVCK